MDSEAQAVWKEFENFHRPNGSNATRHAIIDRLLRSELEADSAARVVVVGAGFDTRAFRLRGGRWVEIDEPALLARKESRLPTGSAPNSLTRVPIQFASESLGAKLAPFAGPERTHVVVEGVLMYLTLAQRRALLEPLRKCYPHHVVYCDLMRESFANSYGREIREKLASMGAPFRDVTEHPERLFTEAGYVRLACESIPLTAAERGAIDVPAFAIRWFMRKLRRGYCVWKWERRAG